MTLFALNAHQYIIQVLYLFFYPREHSSIGRDIAYYMLWLEFEPGTLHFFTIKLCELQPLSYLTKNQSKCADVSLFFHFLL